VGRESKTPFAIHNQMKFISVPQMKHEALW